MIKTFKCKETEKIWNEEFSKKLPQEIQKRALQNSGLSDVMVCAFGSEKEFSRFKAR